MERERERENQRVMDDDIENSSDGELMFSGPTRSDYLVVVDSEFPRQIQNHPFHPSHPLFLVKPKDFGVNHCNSCGKYCGSGIFFYRCDLCAFDLDTNCSKLIPTIKYLGHPDHPFFLLTTLIIIQLFKSVVMPVRKNFVMPVRKIFMVMSSIVFRAILISTLIVFLTKLSIRFTDIFFTLTTSIKKEDRGINELVCYECEDKINPDEPVYYCAKCYYPLHIGCSSEAIADHDESGQIFIGADKAMVKLIKDVQLETSNLNKQKKELTALKETSTKFPLKIKHPFHSQHPLTLTHCQNDFQIYSCSVCKRRNSGFRYHCFECDFSLDLNCVLRKPTIKYDGHQEHILIFLKNFYGNHKRCNACGQDCDKSPILRCVDCNFNLHIDCFPSLPPTFKNPQCHLHTLTLTNSFAGDLSTDEFYCDFCEDRRDPKHLVYYYEECPFVAHITCVLYEELPSILAELDSTKRDGGVEESVFVDISNNAIEDEVAKIDVERRELQLESNVLCLEQRELQLRLAELEEKLAEIKVKQKELDDKRERYLASVF